MSNNGYALLKVDTEALPSRAETNHVRRLILDVHGNDTAFMDLRVAFAQVERLRNVTVWQDNDGQDVEWHVHHEYPHLSFWKEAGYPLRSKLLNQYKDAKKDILRLNFFVSEICQVTSKKIEALRAGAYCCNAITLRMLSELDILLSFNNTIVDMRIKRNPYSIPHIRKKLQKQKTAVANDLA